MPLVEMHLMEEAGMTPVQIITAGTKHAAHVCDFEYELGTIETNRIADVIIVNGNPFKDLKLLLDIKMVIHNGEIIINNIKASQIFIFHHTICHPAQYGCCPASHER
jgi:imidazolonepropionase-like amidohydrolase